MGEGTSERELDEVVERETPVSPQVRESPDSQESEPRGWHSRGYLPHIDAGSVPQFVTWRLKDAIQPWLIDQWRRELSALSEQDSSKQLLIRINHHLDEGHGSKILSNPVAARIVQDALIYYHGSSYTLHAWVVMPTHVHALFTPTNEKSFREILRPLKGYTSREIHRHLGGCGELWQRDYFDRMPRDEVQFLRIVKYIEWNPVKAKLCSDPSKWPYSSANPVAMKRVLLKAENQSW